MKLTIAMILLAVAVFATPAHAQTDTKTNCVVSGNALLCSSSSPNGDTAHTVCVSSGNYSGCNSQTTNINPEPSPVAWEPPKHQPTDSAYENAVLDYLVMSAPPLTPVSVPTATVVAPPVRLSGPVIMPTTPKPRVSEAEKFLARVQSEYPGFTITDAFIVAVVQEMNTLGFTQADVNEKNLYTAFVSAKTKHLIAVREPELPSPGRGQQKFDRACQDKKPGETANHRMCYEGIDAKMYAATRP
jgi:hypothetical protein